MKKKYNISSIENPNYIFGTRNKLKNKRGPNTPADFEEAISAAGYGKFNILVLFTMIPPGFATAFSTTMMSYIFPIAQCDLGLSLDNKGMLNSVTYIGMIASGFLFGYLTDAIGRRKLIVYIYIIDGLLIALCGLSQQYIPLLIIKFLEGFVVNGGYAAYIAYANEFHAAKYRPFLAMYNGILMNLTAIVLPSLAWLIFTDQINISFFDDYIILRSWNIFLFVCTIPSLSASLMFLLMPESPKFLMSIGKNKEALQVFRQVYSSNTGLSPDTYPIRVLVEEKPQETNSNGETTSTQQCGIESLKNGWHETTRLFYPPYVTKIILVLIIDFGYLLGLNTLRLWIPQLFITIYDQEIENKGKEFDFCSSLQTLNFANKTQNAICTVNYENRMVYIYVIICSVAMIGILLISMGIIAKISKKTVLVISGCLSGIFCTMIYFSQDLPMLMILYLLHVAFLYITTNVVLAVIVNVFPTSLRAMAIALTLASGRTGSAVGNMLFPVLLSTGCIYPFATLGAAVAIVSLMTLLLPDTEMTPLP